MSRRLAQCPIPPPAHQARKGTQLVRVARGELRAKTGKSETGHGRFYYLHLNQRLKSRAEGFSIASLILLRGAKPKVISEALGHSSVAFTMDVYSHIIEGMQSDAMSLLDEVLPVPKNGA